MFVKLELLASKETSGLTVLIEILIFFMPLLLFPPAVSFYTDAGAYLAPLQFDCMVREASHQKLSLSSVQETTNKATYLH